MAKVTSKEILFTRIVFLLSFFLCATSLTVKAQDFEVSEKNYRRIFHKELILQDDESGRIRCKNCYVDAAGRAKLADGEGALIEETVVEDFFNTKNTTNAKRTFRTVREHHCPEESECRFRMFPLEVPGAEAGDAGRFMVIAKPKRYPRQENREDLSQPRGAKKPQQASKAETLGFSMSLEYGDQDSDERRLVDLRVGDLSGHDPEEAAIIQEDLKAIATGAENFFRHIQRGHRLADRLAQDYERKKKYVDAQLRDIQRNNMAMKKAPPQYMVSPERLEQLKSGSYQAQKNPVSNVEKRNRAEEIMRDPLSYRIYDFSDSEIEKTLSDFKTALKKQRYRELVKNGEILQYADTSDEYLKERITEALSEVYNDEGVLSVSKLTHGYSSGPYDEARLETYKKSEIGQVVRRLANRYQVDWIESESLTRYTDKQTLRYLLGATTLRSADYSFGDPLRAFTQAPRYLAASEAISDFGDGFVDGMKSYLELIKSIPELAGKAQQLMAVVQDNPDIIFEKAMSLMMDLPGIATNLLFWKVQMAADFYNGDAYERGRITADLAVSLAMIYVTGLPSTAKLKKLMKTKASNSARAGVQKLNSLLNKSGKALKRVVEDRFLNTPLRRKRFREKIDTVLQLKEDFSDLQKKGFRNLFGDDPQKAKEWLSAYMKKDIGGEELRVHLRKLLYDNSMKHIHSGAVAEYIARYREVLGPIAPKDLAKDFEILQKGIRNTASVHHFAPEFLREGPLAQKTASTKDGEVSVSYFFHRRQYTEVTSKDPVTLYRVYSREKDRFGKMWILQDPREHEEFKGKNLHYYKIEVPAGEKIYKGYVSRDWVDRLNHLDTREGLELKYIRETRPLVYFDPNTVFRLEPESGVIE